MLVAALVALMTVGTSSAVAEGNHVRISQQFGLNWLALDVMLDQKLIEKRAAELGVPDVQVSLVKLSGGPAANDALLSGRVDIAGMGGTPAFILHERTAERENVKAIGAVVDAPMYLITTDPRIRSVRDFTDKDRIALPAPRVSINAMILQMEAAKLYGVKDAAKFDTLQVGMPHPDAAATLIAGNTEVKNWVGIFPFSDEVLAKAKGARVVLSSYDVVGGPHNLAVLVCSETWKKENPRLFKAVALALDDAMSYINADKRRAAELFVRVTKSSLSTDTVYKIISAPDVVFSSTPKKTMAFASFMYQMGLLKKKPTDWKEFFWENQYDRPGD
jgi:NitT/TauT family transport system substrate-binding protein